MEAIQEGLQVIEDATGITFQLKKEKLCNIDTIACGALKRECPDYAVPMCQVTQDSIDYHVSNEWGLLESFQGKFNIQQVIRLYDQILDMFKTCGDWYLNVGGFCFKKEYVCVHKQHTALQCLYIPEEEAELNWEDLRNLLLGILIQCDENSGSVYQVRLFQLLCLKEWNWETFKNVVKQIKKEMASEAWHTSRHCEMEISDGAVCDQSAQQEEIMENVGAALEEKEDSIGSEASAQLLHQKIEDMLQEVYHSNELILKCMSEQAYYDLPEQIVVRLQGKPFVIGRATKKNEGEKVDYEFDTTITPISRIHAQITKREEQYYLQDLGSSNGTYLNGKRLEAKKEYPIQFGDAIAFAVLYGKESIEYAVISAYK